MRAELERRLAKVKTSPRESADAVAELEWLVANAETNQKRRVVLAELDQQISDLSKDLEQATAFGLMSARA